MFWLSSVQLCHQVVVLFLMGLVAGVRMETHEQLLGEKVGVGEVLELLQKLVYLVAVRIGQSRLYRADDLELQSMLLVHLGNSSLGVLMQLV